MGETKQTALFKTHQKYSARFTEFGGWNMPVSYSGLIDEHQTVRNAAALFDVSHMGEIFVRGERAFEFLQHIGTNDLSKIVSGQAQYSLLLNEEGAVIDDIIIYMFDRNNYLLCVNAGNADIDWQWISEQNTFGVELENASSAYGQIALQGPKSREVIKKIIPEVDFSVENFKAFYFKQAKGNYGEIIIACTGYTGEDGFEIFCMKESSVKLWEDLMQAGAEFGIKPAGLGARDTLRLEVCYPLHGHELRADLSAMCSAVSWVIKFDKPNFIGKSALEKIKSEGVPYKLVGLEVLDRGIVREGAKLFSQDGVSKIGWVSSGTKTPTADKSIALALVEPKYSAVGQEFKAEVRDKLLAVRVVTRPFVKPNTVS